MSDTTTPRTDAAAFQQCPCGKTGCNVATVEDVARTSRQLERELAEMTRLERERNQTANTFLEQVRRLQHEIAAEQEAREKAEDKAKELTVVGLITRLGAEQQRAEQAEARLAEAIEALQLLHDHQNGCPLPSYEKQWTKAMRQSEHILSSTEPPALLKEVEELRKLVHQLQGVPFSDRNYGALKDKLNIACQALEDLKFTPIARDALAKIT